MKSGDQSEGNANGKSINRYWVLSIQRYSYDNQSQTFNIDIMIDTSVSFIIQILFGGLVIHFCTG
jgi:hypothetical protein